MFEGRSQGVRIPDGQRTTKAGEPNTVTRAYEASMVAVEYTDENGRQETDVLFKVGNTIYMPRDSKQWTGALKPCSKWLAQGVLNILADQKPVDAPTHDSVDVVAASAAKEASDERPPSA